MSADAGIPGPDRRRPSAPLFRPRVGEEVSGELDFHIEMRTREYIAAGMDPVAARAAALRRFGDVAEVDRLCRGIARRRNRTMSVSEWLDQVRRDVVFGVRQLRSSPGFALVAVLTLGLGTGATAAIFSVVDHVLLRPLAFPGAERVVIPETARRGTDERSNVTWADFEDWRESGLFANVAAYQTFDGDFLVEDGEPERVNGAVVTDEFFAALGVTPVLGRFPTAEEMTPGTPLVTVLSWGLWQRAFGGRADAIGRTIALSGTSGTVIGVAPAGLEWPVDAQLWFPLRLSLEAVDVRTRRDNRIFQAVARLGAGRTLKDTGLRVEEIAARVERENPVIRKDVTVVLTPLDDWLVGERFTRSLWLFLAAVGLVLLIGCVNVANLLLGRAARRGREMAMRQALGASRGRLISQMLTESMLLAGAGCLAGLLFARGLLPAMLAMAPAGVPRIEGVDLDARALGFAAALSVLAALVFGAAPALVGSRRSYDALASGALRTTSSRKARRARDVLVIVEMAMSLVLLVGAGLLVKSLSRLRGVDPGLRTDHVLTFSLSLPGRYGTAGGFWPAFRDVAGRLAELPGARSAAIASSLPLGGGGFYLGRAFLAEGAPEPPGGIDTSAEWVVVSPGYFETMGIPLAYGRDFTAEDRADGVQVMVLGAETARLIFGDPRAAIGRRVRSWRDENVYREVVGVVGDVRVYGADDDPQPVVYVPHAQSAWRSMIVAIRTDGDPLAILPAARASIGALDPRLALGAVTTMDDVFATSVAPRRFAAFLLSAFALLALLLAAVGIYGVLSYAVAQRTREIGVRIALGAERRTVLGMVMREAGLVVGIGSALGAAGALLLARVVSSLLYDVSATDPATLVLTTLILAGVALAASLLPARRATRIDPLTAMRAD